MNNLSQRDRQLLWHPLTQHKTHPGMMGIASAKGVYLYSEEGERYLDAISSWYTCMYGHCNDYIIKQVYEQMQNLDQVVFSGFTHEPAVALAEALVEVLPPNQKRFFFSDNGSTAVEVAIKMALQYHHNTGAPKNVFIALEEGFHGDTFGAMSVSGLSVYNGPFEEFFLEVKRIPRPGHENLEEVLQATAKILDENEVAGFIYEPLIQGAAGMKMIHPGSLNALLKMLKDRGVVLIADEVMTGFGKAGTYFASDQLEQKPDLICLSKALTAGLLPMGLTSCTAQIYDAFLSDHISKGFFHGHTYTANPLACSAAKAALELLRSEQIQNNIGMIEQSHAEFDKRTKELPMVLESRYKGVIYALDINTQTDRYGHLRDDLYNRFMKKGIFLRPLGNTIYILPPYIITSDQLEDLYGTIEEVLTEIF